MESEGVQHDAVVPKLLKWSEVIQKDFLLRNFAYLPGTRVRAVIGDFFNGVGDEGNESDETREMMNYFTADWRPLIGYYNFVSRRMVTMQSLLHDIRQEVVKVNERLDGFAHQMGVQSQQIDVLIQLNTQMVELLGGTHGSGAALSGVTIAAAVTPSPARRPTIGTPEQPTAVSSFPQSTREMKVVHCFVLWHTKRWYEFVSTKETKHAYGMIRSAVAYLGIFLPRQVPACPAGLQPRDHGTEDWQNEMQQLATEAFESFKEWRKTMVPRGAISEAPDTLKRFCDEVKEVPHAEWPAGPPGETPFPPPASKPNGERNERKRLIDNQETREQQRQQKRLRQRQAEAATEEERRTET